MKSNARLLLLWALLTALCSVGFLSAWDVAGKRTYLNKNYFFSSEPFYEQLRIHFNLIKYVHFDNKAYPGMTREEVLDNDYIRRMEQYNETQKRQRESALLSEARSLRTKGSVTADSAERWQRQAQEDLAASFAQMDRDLEKAKAEYAAYRTREYAEVAKSLAGRSGQLYYSIRNTLTGETVSNGDPPDGQAVLYAVFFPAGEAKSGSFQQINRYFQQNRLEGSFMIPQEPRGYSQLHADYAYFLAIRERLIKEIGLGAAALLAAAALYLYMRKSGAAGVRLPDLPAAYKRLPLDVRLLAALAAGAAVCIGAGSLPLFRLPPSAAVLLKWALLCVLILFVALNAKEGGRLLRDRERLRLERRSCLCCRLRKTVETRFADKKMTVKALVVFAMTSLLSIALAMLIIGLDEHSGGFVLFGGGYIALYALTVVPYALRRIAAFNTILAGAEAIAAGDFNTAIEEKGNGHFRRLASQLNNVKAGLQASLESRMKSERLKSELITNVSHDLKTPLTSIINYVDLLKNKELTREEIDSYVGVLERKTGRLKALIDDLFEASKMASGAVELTLEEVNVASLLQQALAEFGEQINASACTFKLHIPEGKIVARLDGKKTWRVFENLIGNALKYAMPHTRVHVSLEERESFVAFTVKNVSAYEIDFDPSELTERFKRADPSRHTEGSGLGLAIAKSIVELQGGQLAIDIDGDYFKVTATFPK